MGYEDLTVTRLLVLGSGCRAMHGDIDITAGLYALSEINAAELHVLDGVTPGTAAASKAVVLDASKGISTITSATITTATVTTLNATTANVATLRLSNTAWDDLRIVPAASDFPGNADPDLVEYAPGGSGTTLKVYEYAKGDYVTFLCQLPHNRKPATDLKCHVHWTPGPRGNEEADKVVAWQLEYSAASIGSAFPVMQSLDLKDTVTGTDHVHEISPSGTITGSSLGLSSMLLCKLSRISTNDTWAGTTAGQLPILLEFDIHYEIDRLGSDNETTND